MKFLFDESSIQELTGKRLVLSNNTAFSNEFVAIQDIVPQLDGTLADSKGKWEVIDGVLRLLDDKDHLVTEFRTLETRNKVVYAVGRNVLEVNTASRPILHVKKPVGANFGICISSHVNYEKVAVPRLLRSLEGDGFQMDRVVVVIGSDAKDVPMAVDPDLKVNVVRRQKTVYGLTSLGSVPNLADRAYWLLLHDTCEVTNGFDVSLMDLDVGLNPDIVTLRPTSEKMELGLYASTFAEKMGDISRNLKPYEYFKAVADKAGIISVLQVPVKKGPERDVYGRGIQRETLSFEQLGIKKHKAKSLDVKKP